MTAHDQDNAERTALEPLLTSDDLRRLFRVTSRTIARWYASGRLPRPVKVGGGNRWRADQIRRLVESRA
jgi:hypothetical protein